MDLVCNTSWSDILSSFSQFLSSSPNHVSAKKKNDLSIQCKKKKKDHFNGMPVDEILSKKLPDHLAPNLDLLFVSYDSFKHKDWN